MRVSNVVLRAADPERLRAFYREIAGAPDELIDLRPVDGARAPAPGSTGLFHTAIRFASPGHLAEALRRIARARVPLTGASDHGVSHALYLNDPEGNGVELYFDMPEAQWPRTPDGGLAMSAPLPLDLEELLRTAPPDGDGTPDIGHIHLSVGDVNPSLDFYVDGLGLDLQQRYGPDAGFVSADGYHHHIGMNTWQSRGGSPAPPDTTGLDSFTLTFDDLVPVLARLAERDIPFERDGDAVVVRDPDRIPVRLEEGPA
jgi:catechol 2,3-dioxygenase